MASTMTRTNLERNVERAERHGWVAFFEGHDVVGNLDHVHLECRGRDGELRLITVDANGSVGVYGSI